MAETSQQTTTAPVEPVAPWRTLTEPIGDDARTVYDGHITLGEIVKERNELWKKNEELNQTLGIRDREKVALQKAVGDRQSQLLVQSDRIQSLEKAEKEQGETIADLQTRNQQLAQQLARSQRANEEKLPEMERLSDGSLRLMIRVPEEQAIPLLSWAHDAGEEPQSYCQKVVEDALVSVVSS